ncbi:hypothetical protein TanjilG_25946 [Lupinus angustifolius]|uniref:23 kDa subunit of oxygen evolving system of photosystem II n=1 Tax=Lupinus angustifolius TaxID=3871 RepID=A0A394DM74_LUPAN|nr:hypothetical protein TanjilG_25946 [Lupinus angustifolius]
MASTQCLLHQHALTTLARSSSSQRIVVNTKPNQLVCKAHKNAPQDDNTLSRRLALSVLIGAAAVASKVSPADAAYGEAANVFGKPKANTDFLPYNGDGFKLLIPAKWNRSKEVEYVGQVLRYEDNFDVTSNLVVTVTPTDKKSIKDYGAPEEFLSKVDYLLGKQAFFGETASEVSDYYELNEKHTKHHCIAYPNRVSTRIFQGGFDANAVATANILETAAPVVDGKEYYYLSVLTRTADGDEGGKHQLISATVKDGRLYILKAQAGDKRWFKGAKKFVESAATSFSVA